MTTINGEVGCGGCGFVLYNPGPNQAGEFCPGCECCQPEETEMDRGMIHTLTLQDVKEPCKRLDVVDNYVWNGTLVFNTGGVRVALDLHGVEQLTDFLLDWEDRGNT